MRAVITLIVACLTAVSAAAQGLGTAGDVAKVRLLEGWRQQDGVHTAAVEIRLAPGWHTYWRAPGAAGIPPQFDWSASSNLAAVRYEWPRPIVFDTYGVPTIGYAEHLVLPVFLTPVDPSLPVEADLDLFFGVCDEICIPAEARVAAHLPAEDRAAEGPAGGVPDIEDALARRALRPAEAGVEQVRCALDPGERGYEVTAEVVFAGVGPGPESFAVVESGRPDIWIGAPRSERDGPMVRTRARLEQAGHPDGLVLDRSALRVTVLSDDRFVDIRGCPPAGLPAPVVQGTRGPLTLQ